MAEYKDISDLKKQIADFKKAVFSTNSDYLTGYICALSATEGIIAELPDVDVVEVVRCKNCKNFKETNGKDSGKPCGYGQCMKPFFIQMIVDADDFCSYGERKDNENP